MATIRSSFRNTSTQAENARPGRDVTSLDSIDRNGMVKVPMGPGLGAEYDWNYIAKNSTGKVTV